MGGNASKDQTHTMPDTVAGDPKTDDHDFPEDVKTFFETGMAMLDRPILGARFADAVQKVQDERVALSPTRTCARAL